MTKLPVSVLFLEDDLVDFLAIKRSFEKHNIEADLIHVKNGQLAEPFIILLDLNMPMMGGIEFLQNLRQLPEHKNTVVFVLTTSKLDEDVRLSYTLNVAGFFVKNEMTSGPEKVIQLINLYCQLSHFPVKEPENSTSID